MGWGKQAIFYLYGCGEEDIFGQPAWAL